ncbi:type I restriction endonuclease subunit R [Geodermatophilus sp. SYSU D01105]
MSDVGQPERKTQNRVVAMVRDRLGYQYLGNWEKRAGNSNVETDLLRANLIKRGYSEAVVSKAVAALDRARLVGGGRSLYEANKEVYDLLRYGAKVSPEAGKPKQTVEFIDWEHPEANDFAVAEEVSVEGQNNKRPDVVLYVNGIAVAVLELKRSFVSVSEGIRQHLGNQKADFIKPFFSTVQLMLAGNDVEGLRYGVIETREKYWLTWKLTSDMDDVTRAAMEACAAGLEQPLDRALAQMCTKGHLLEIVHDFMVFEAGVKKTCRPNQYFGVKAAQARIATREGGIIWHTQGAGKSLTMVWLAKWIREHQEDPRVLIITDRTELDEQIEGVFLGVKEQVYRAKSGADLIAQLNTSEHWLMCSLIHKFGKGGEGDSIEEYIAELKKSLPPDFAPRGNFFVFVDECHRTQSGRLHEAMKELLPGAMLIGFTGTPLLKTDKQKSIETFGSYIHTYKFDEAVRDGVVLDLRYEARDIDQEITSLAKVDQWFDNKTKGLTDLARAELKKRWGTMQRVLSSKSRAEKIVADILMDMDTKERLANGRGNAMLVGSSIYQACKFYELFSQTSLKGKVAIVTSYEPNPSDIAKEDAGEGLNEALRQYEIHRKMLADYFDEPADQAMHKVEEFERQVKQKFIDEPGQMRLLIVVDKLLTGFDAPSATYLYIDKQMRDHGLFQAICRVNRLDGDDKDYGYIVDYKDLFRSIEGAVTDYTAGALDGYDEEDVAGLLEDRLEKGRVRLEEALEAIRLLCEPVSPKDTRNYQHYFCAADTGDAQALKRNEPKRVALYKAVTALVRAYANIANEMTEAGYSVTEAMDIKAEVQHYERVRQEVKLGAGENIDYKAYEADMRYLLDTYIRASDSETVTTFEDQGLIDLIVKHGVTAAVDQLPDGIKASPEAVAETIENNTRKLITDEQPINPKYFDKMSQLLDALIELRRQQAIEYKEYLERLAALAKQVAAPETGSDYPAAIASSALRSLYDNLDGDEALALKLGAVILSTKKDSWRGNRMKEREVYNAIRRVLSEEAPTVDVDALFEVVKHQHEY